MSNVKVKIESLNGDSTYLLRFSSPTTAKKNPSPENELTILLDPWLHSSAPVYHPRFSTQTHLTTPVISSLKHLHPPPDLVLISQAKNDHCHLPTLAQLDWDGGDTEVVAVAEAARRVRGAGFVEGKRVWGLGQKVRILRRRGYQVEVEVVRPKWFWELPGLHAALLVRVCEESPAGEGGGVSVLYSPHGTPGRYVRSRLEGDGKANVDVLLHPWNEVRNPWWLGGRVSAGFKGGSGIESGCWVAAHDGEKEVGGFVGGFVRKRAWTGDEEEEGGGRKLVKLGVGGWVEIGKGGAVDAGEGLEVFGGKEPG